MKPFYTRLSYSFGNEDFRTEKKALQPKANDNIMVITASGDRPLNLLSEEVGRIYSIDANPIQNALLDLKKAALKHLSYEQYLAFLGITPCKERLHTYQMLQKDLQPETIEQLLTYQKQIAKGIIFQGAVEKLILTASLAIRTLRGNKANRLFTFDDIEEQATFVEKHWNTPSLRTLFKLAVSPYVSRIILKDPGLYEHISHDIKSSSHLYNRYHSSLVNFLARENPLLSLCFQGKVYEEGYPPYLQESKCTHIRKQLDKIEFSTIDLISSLEEQPDNSFDAFSLSDVSSYLSQQDFCRMVKEMVRAAKPGARFCLRQFLSDHRVPEEVAPLLQREPALEKELENEDRCFVYRFMVGTINK